MTERFDLVVIGAGAAGLTAAGGAAMFGLRVALIEAAAMGGECLNTGCVPSKALIAAAARADVGRSGNRLGVALGCRQSISRRCAPMSIRRSPDSRRRTRRRGSRLWGSR